MKKKISLRSIAEELNLSKTTVSWILSGQGLSKGFNIDTIKRVNDYASAVHYRPNQLARSLSLGKSHSIGLIVPYISDTFYAQMIEYIEQEISKKNYFLTICCSQGNAKKELELIHILQSKQVDGIIIAPTDSSGAVVSTLESFDLPFVLIDRFFKERNTNYVVLNNQLAATKLVNQLVARHATKIALVVSDTYLTAIRDRMEGYTDGLKQAGLPFEEKLVITVNRATYREEMPAQLATFLQQQPDVDAILFATHYLAFAAIKYFIQKKIPYTSNYQLACFHQMEALDVLAPGMLVAQMPLEKMCTEAVHILMDAITNEASGAKQMVFEPTILSL